MRLASSASARLEKASAKTATTNRLMMKDTNSAMAEITKLISSRFACVGQVKLSPYPCEHHNLCITVIELNILIKI